MYLHVVPWVQVFGPPLASLRHRRWKWHNLFMGPEPPELALLFLELEEAEILGLPGGGRPRRGRWGVTRAPSLLGMWALICIMALTVTVVTGNILNGFACRRGLGLGLGFGFLA